MTDIEPTTKSFLVCTICGFPAYCMTYSWGVYRIPICASCDVTNDVDRRQMLIAQLKYGLTAMSEDKRHFYEYERRTYCNYCGTKLGIYIYRSKTDEHVCVDCNRERFK